MKPRVNILRLQRTCPHNEQIEWKNLQKSGLEWWATWDDRNLSRFVCFNYTDWVLSCADGIVWLLYLCLACTKLKHFSKFNHTYITTSTCSYRCCYILFFATPAKIYDLNLTECGPLNQSINPYHSFIFNKRTLLFASTYDSRMPSTIVISDFWVSTIWTVLVIVVSISFYQIATLRKFIWYELFFTQEAMTTLIHEEIHKS